MKQKKFIPPTLQEAENYVREKALLVDPEWFINYYSAADWADSNGKSVKNWKQKMWALHRMQLGWGRPHKCSVGGCRGQGIYISGADRDGHPYYWCINHKPKPKPVSPQVAALADKALKPKVPREQSTSVKVNKQVRKLLDKS